MIDIQMWWDRPELTVRFDPGAKIAAPGELLVGLGNAQREESGVALNNKTSAKRERSVAEHVVLADAAQVQVWRNRLLGGLDAVRCIVLEDLSLDSCFALLALTARLGGAADSPALTEQWLGYVTAWEQGNCLDFGDLSKSVAILHTVLGHSYLQPEDGVKGIEPEEFVAGFRACLNFLNAIVKQTVNPLQPQLPQQADAYLRAIAHYYYEYQQYRLALRHGITCQLSVPLRGSQRQLTIDALILEERRSSGVLKTFARQDRKHTWTHNGFALLAIYRPHEQLTGNDMTLSVTPETGLTLSRVWHALEALEENRWKGERPRDQPRDILSYREDALGHFIESPGSAGGSTRKSYQLKPKAPNEPWWDDQGRYTLLGAPKGIKSANGERIPGTRLDWHADVIPLLWRACKPVPADVIVELKRKEGNKVGCLVRWLGNANLSIAESPSFLAWLAACSMNKQIQGPGDLPPADSFKTLRVDGGCVLVHRDGVTWFDDWSPTKLAVATFDELFHALAIASYSYAQFIGDQPLVKAAAQLRRIRKDQHLSRKGLNHWKEESLRKKAQMLEIESRLLEHADTVQTLAVRKALERHWGLSEQRREVMELLDQIDSATTEILLTIKERRDRFVTASAAGFGLALATHEALDAASKYYTANAYEWQLKLFRGGDPADLHVIAVSLKHWDAIVFLGSGIGLIVGFVLYWFFGTRFRLRAEQDG